MARASISSTISATGAGTAVKVRKTTLSYAATSSSLVGSVQLQRSIDGGLNWQVIATITDTVAATSIFEDGEAMYRFFCTARTSGSLAVTLLDIGTIPGSVWRRQPAFIGTSGGTVPGRSAIRTGIYSYAFDKTAAEDVDWSIVVPSDITPNSPMHLAVHWTPGSSTDTGTVVWTLDYSKSAPQNSGVFAAVTSFDTAAQAGAGVAYTHQIVSATEAQAIEDCTPGDVILGHITRKVASDNFDADAFLVAVVASYQSTQRGTVSRVYPFT